MVGGWKVGANGGGVPDGEGSPDARKKVGRRGPRPLLGPALESVLYQIRERAAPHSRICFLDLTRKARIRIRLRGERVLPMKDLVSGPRSFEIFKLRRTLALRARLCCWPVRRQVGMTTVVNLVAHQRGGEFVLDPSERLGDPECSTKDARPLVLRCASRCFVVPRGTALPGGGSEHPREGHLEASLRAAHSALGRFYAAKLLRRIRTRVSQRRSCSPVGDRTAGGGILLKSPAGSGSPRIPFRGT